MTEQDEVDQRLAATRERVRREREGNRELRRRLREVHAVAASVVDRSTVARLRSQGIDAAPPVPSRLPDELA